MENMDKIVSQHDSILLIMRREKAEKILPNLEKAITQYNVNILIEESSISGIVKFQKTLPCLVLIDNDISDMVGLSAAAIIKEAVLKEQYACAVYVTGVNSFVENIKADRIFSDLEANVDKLVIQSIQTYLENRLSHMARSEEFRRAKSNQRDLLPNYFSSKRFDVVPIFSPFHELSGDGIDYWYSESVNKLFGFVYDCTGHDLVSFIQSGEMRAMFRGAFRFYEMGFYRTLDQIMTSTNEQLFTIYPVEKCVPVAAILFEFDFEENVLKICPAGIPSYLIRKKDEPERTEVALSSFLLGFLNNLEYETVQVPLDDVKEVIFSTDGFSELLRNQKNGVRTRAKHDDVSAVMVQIN